MQSTSSRLYKHFEPEGEDLPSRAGLRQRFNDRQAWNRQDFEKAVRKVEDPERLHEMLMEPAQFSHESACQFVADQGRVFDQELVGYLLAAEPSVAMTLAQNPAVQGEAAGQVEEWALGMAQGFWVDPGPGEEKIRQGLRVLVHLRKEKTLRQPRQAWKAFQKARQQNTPLAPGLEKELQKLKPDTKEQKTDKASPESGAYKKKQL